MNHPPTPENINEALKSIEVAELRADHPRKLAQKALAQYRRMVAIDPDYRFENTPKEARQVIYDMTVKYGAQHSWLARLRRR